MVHFLGGWRRESARGFSACVGDGFGRRFGLIVWCWRQWRSTGDRCHFGVASNFHVECASGRRRVRALGRRCCGCELESLAGIRARSRLEGVGPGRGARWRKGMVAVRAGGNAGVVVGCVGRCFSREPAPASLCMCGRSGRLLVKVKWKWSDAGGACLERARAAAR